MDTQEYPAFHFWEDYLLYFVGCFFVLLLPYLSLVHRLVYLEDNSNLHPVYSNPEDNTLS